MNSQRIGFLYLYVTPIGQPQKCCPHAVRYDVVTPRVRRLPLFDLGVLGASAEDS